ncbi:tyrosinase family protein [Rivularia sp. PCC 7116]|uniref:tyrosinase family protein n=1 Tax=Rivularia sp. PCC 7116 TaxID=373994 RepID=UPI00029F305D|nr:tyrosinase family protein [Rivularia sp. PCC 7116]AFY55832.1 tyrosinase family protein [Rivularia sp. PCC 7116]
MKHLPKILAKMTVGMAIVFSISQAPAIAASLVRKNVIDLTPQEKADFVDAIKTLKTTPGTNDNQVSIYDEIVAIHTGAMAFTPKQLGGLVTLPQDTPATGQQAGVDAAHGNSAFLPWHREYLNRFEKALQSVNPNVTIPYWDWTDPRSVDAIFQPDFLGTNGSGQPREIRGRDELLEGGPLQSGNFSAADGWNLIPDLHTNVVTGETLGSSIVRYLPPDSNPPEQQLPLDNARIDRLLQSDNYNRFRLALEGRTFIDENGNEQICTLPCTHNLIHALVGGGFVDQPPDLSDLNPPAEPPPLEIVGTMNNVPGSPNDPVFWLHHSNVERLWAEWQNNGRQGSEFYAELGTQPQGHDLNDRMWPWDGGASIPGSVSDIDITPYLPSIAPEDIVKVSDTLNLSDYHYTYDTIVNKGQVIKVPETNSIFGLFGLGVVGAICLRRRKGFFGS